MQFTFLDVTVTHFKTSGHTNYVHLIVKSLLELVSQHKSSAIKYLSGSLFAELEYKMCVYMSHISEYKSCTEVNMNFLQFGECNYALSKKCNLILTFV
jgi:hypothetical protein